MIIGSSTELSTALQLQQKVYNALAGSLRRYIQADRIDQSALGFALFATRTNTLEYRESQFSQAYRALKATNTTATTAAEDVSTCARQGRQRG